MRAELQIQEHVPLAGLTTMGVGGPARYFVEICKKEDIPEALAFAVSKKLPVFVLGGGSNIVVSDAGFDGVVLYMRIHGIERLSETRNAVLVRAAAGENWDTFVADCVAAGLWGVENLSLIPGTVGAVPIQNVGAYGQEAADVVRAVEAWDLEHQQWVNLSASECSFSYRRSVFNTTEAKRYIITGVTFELKRKSIPVLSHTAVGDYLCRREPGLWSRVRPRLFRWVGGATVRHLDCLLLRCGIQEMRDAVIALRTDGRLPDYHQVGNAGSFFKNVTLPPDHFDRLLERLRKEFSAEIAKRIEDMGRRFEEGGEYKIPAGELVKICGIRNSQKGSARLYERNPIIIANTDGHATGADIRALAEYVIKTVYERTGVQLETEPRWVGFPDDMDTKHQEGQSDA